MAKCPNSLTDNPKIIGAPKDFTITIRDIRVSTGAKFIICLTGDVMTMPGLSKEPMALKIDIDDDYNVGYYDKLTEDGIVKGATRSLDPAGYAFISRRFDTIADGDRNKNFMYPDVDMPLVEGAAKNGDPDGNWYLGSRIDNSYHPMTDEHRWNGIMNVIPPTDPFISDDKRVPTGKPIKGEEK